MVSHAEAIRIDQASSQSKTAVEPYVTAPPVEELPNGVWRINNYEAAKVVMLSDATTQAGFKSELLEKMPKYMALPILFQTGAAHRENRSGTARYFTPTTTRERYLPIMERCADRVVAGFRRAGTADLNKMASDMAMTVAAEVIGLTNSPVRHMLKHLMGILTAKLTMGLKPKDIVSYAKVQWHLANFYLGDVMPAIRARRKAPQKDVISHMLAKDAKSLDILTECIMYGAAGMVTTQEFISVGMWHCLNDPQLKAIMLGDDEAARTRLLHELLRLEPVVGHLYRRASADLTVPGADGPVTIPAGALIDMHVYSINADTRVTGAAPLDLSPERKTVRGVPGSVISFGAGAHRCAGEFIAMAETDVLMRRLLALPGLRIARRPAVGQNDITSGYELRHFIVTLNAKSNA